MGVRIQAWGGMSDLWLVTCSTCSIYEAKLGRAVADDFAAQHRKTHESATEPADPFEGPDFMAEM
jgi:hypothetical protein